MPDAFKRYGESWREFHPGWEMRLWTDDDLPALTDPRVLRRARHHAERANLLRYELLRRFGGVYIDTDFECLRPIEPLLAGVRAFVGLVRPARVGNAIMGGMANHPLFCRAAELATERVGTGPKSPVATGPVFLTELVKGFRDVTVFGSEIFYPYTAEERDSPPAALGDAYAVHHWAATWREPLDLEEKLAFLRVQALKARRRKRALQQARNDQAELKRKLDRTQRRLNKALVVLARRERELAAMKKSPYWRWHPRRLRAVWTRATAARRRRVH